MYSQNITNFSQISTDFLKIYNQITSEEFNNKIIILDKSKIYKYTHGSTAVMMRKFLFGKNKIWIREMPIYQMFYELSHEIGHTLGPNLANKDLHAEETKATLFQYIFSKKVKEMNFEWIDEFIAFEKYRIDHIRREVPIYFKYHQIAKNVVEQANYDFKIGTNIIVQHLDSMNYK